MALNFSSYFFVISHLFILSFSSDQIDCNDYKECDGTNINRTNTKIYCHGAYSCEKGNYVVDSNSNAYHVSCGGVGSCSNVQTMKTNNVYCTSPFSCSNSIFHIANTLTCQGAQSCTNSIFNAVSSITIDAGGEFALYGSTIIATDNDLLIYMFGNYAGYNANIECIGSATCTIQCYSTGCVGLTLSGNGIILISYASDKTLRIDENVNEENNFEIIEYNEECTQNYDEYLPMFVQPLISANKTGSICARGSASGQGVEHITIENNSLICSGEDSCSNVGLIEGDSGNIYCSGQNACASSKMMTNGRIICNGYIACYKNFITASNGIICSGNLACHSSTISVQEGSSSTIIFSGRVSGGHAFVSCHKGSTCLIQCFGSESCDGTIIECFDAVCNVECSVDTKCPQLNTNQPIAQPTINPITNSPSSLPSIHPSNPPSNPPSKAPTFDPTQNPVSQDAVDEPLKDEGNEFPLNLTIIIVFGAILFVCSLCALFYVMRRAKYKANETSIGSIARAEMVASEDLDQTKIIYVHDHYDTNDLECLYPAKEVVQSEQTLQSSQNYDGEGAEGVANGYERIGRILKLIYNDEYEKYLRSFQNEMIDDFKMFEDDQFRSILDEKDEFWEKLMPQKGARIDFFRYVNQLLSTADV